MDQAQKITVVPVSNASNTANVHLKKDVDKATEILLSIRLMLEQRDPI